MLVAMMIREEGELSQRPDAASVVRGSERRHLHLREFVLDHVRRDSKGGEDFPEVIREPGEERRRRRQRHRHWQEGPVAHEQGDLPWSPGQGGRVSVAEESGGLGVARSTRSDAVEKVPGGPDDHHRSILPSPGWVLPLADRRAEPKASRTVEIAVSKLVNGGRVLGVLAICLS